MKENEPVAFSWFTRSTWRYTPMIVELMVIAIVLRLIGLVQPFVFQTLIDRVLPFQRTASLDPILARIISEIELQQTNATGKTRRPWSARYNLIA
jgi:ABC-type bacteriocin/lantibiotic exporter with double-glycine peptidase domain